MKQFISLAEIKSELINIKFPTLDLVIGIATGGTTLAALIAYHLELPLQLMQINYRNAQNKPHHNQPLIIKNLNNMIPPSHCVLLVDDVAVSGQTLEVAKINIEAKNVHTLVIKGKADIILFPDIKTCIDLPWRLSH